MKPSALALFLAAVVMPAPLGAATRVSSNTNCPSADAISQRLLGLLAAGGPATASARVRTEGESLHIELATPGESNQERTVPASGDCEARAEMAALIIAAWLDAMPVGTIGTPGVPPGLLRPPPAPEPAPEPREETEHATRKSDERTLDVHTTIGAGLFGFVDSLGATGGVALAVAMPALLHGFGWSAEASLSLPRKVNVGAGWADYWRPTFALAATRELRKEHWRLRPQLGAVLAVLAIKGQGYDYASSPTTVMWGVGAGMTVARPIQHTEPWLRLEGVLWPQGRSLRSQQVGGPDVVVGLSTWEIRLALGVALGIF